MWQHLLGRSGVCWVSSGRSMVGLHWDSSLLGVGYLKNWHMTQELNEQVSSQKAKMLLMEDSGVLGLVES